MKDFTTIRVQKNLVAELKMAKARLISSGKLKTSATIENVIEELIEENLAKV